MKVYSEEIKILKLRGNDVTDFLHRVSTNDFKNFYDNKVRRTVLITEKGRIVDFITVLNVYSEFIVITSTGREKIVIDFLNKYIVTEDIEINSEKSDKYTLIPEFEHDFEFLSGCNKLEGNYLYLDNYAYKKLVILSQNAESDFQKVLLENCEFINYNEYKKISINRGFLFESNELNEEINPLECYLKDYISFSKGCYIGQEVIARIDSQNKIPKLMVKIISDYQLDDKTKIYVNIDGGLTECGFITSCVKIDNKFLGFGFIKESNLSENYNYIINNNVNNTITINKFKY